MRYLTIATTALTTVLFACGAASGVNVAWVTFHGASEDGSVATAAAVTAGFAAAPDKGYTDMLITAGHTINRVTVPAAANNVAIPPATLAELNAADVVIIGRSVNSGSFQEDAETASWNGSVTKPLILTSGFVSRDSRLAFTTGETTADITGPTRLLAANPAHPVFAGVTLNGSNETAAVLDRVTAPITGNPLQLGTSINNNPLIASGTLIASVTSDSPVAPGGAVIAEYAAGSASGNAGQNFGGKRMLFLTGSRENGITGEGAGILDLSALGQKLFLNSVCYMAGSTTGACAPIVPGDTNGNGLVEYPQDFDPIKMNFRKSVASRALGDLTADGKVDFADFRQWKTAFSGGGGSLAGIDFSFVGGVPEPSTALLALLGLVGLAGRRGGR